MEAMNPSLTVTSAVASDNPFVGLRSFETGDSIKFFGRREQVSELLQKLYSTRFLGVVGSSGCGKSSLVKAGLIPKLQAGFLVAERDSWLQIEMKPGYRPIASLAAALREVMGTAAGTFGTGELANAILQSRTRFVIELLRPALAENKNVFLLVDQFEEIFRYELLKDPDTREESLAFVSMLLALTQRGQLPIYTALTMRSDFIGECDVFPGLPEVLNQSLYLVPRLKRQQRREAIEGPIWLRAATISPRLVDLLLNESDSQPDQLPVLQHALMRTWEEWCLRQAGAAEPVPVDVGDYTQAGALSGALNDDANAAFAALGDAERDLARRMFKALTETDPANRQVRHPARLSELQEITGAGRTAIEHVIEIFNSRGRCFLVTSREPADGDPMIDICHESLIRRWETLGKWAEEAAAFGAVYRRLEEDAYRYPRGETELLSGPQLQRALELWETERPTGAWARRARKSQLFRPEDPASGAAVAPAPSLEEVEKFLYESRDERRREQQRKQDERAREQQRVQHERDREQWRLRDQALAREKAKRLRVAGSLAAVLLITVLGWMLEFLNETTVAQGISRAMEVAATRPQLGLLLGVKAVRFATSAWLGRDALLGEAFLRQAVGGIGGLGLGKEDGSVLSVAVDPRSHFLFSVTSNGTVWRRDLKALSRSPIRVWPLTGQPAAGIGQDGKIKLVAVGGKEVAIGDARGLVTLMNLESCQPHGTLSMIEPQRRQAISALALSPDDRWLVAGDEQGNISKWDLVHDRGELIRRGARQEQPGAEQPAEKQPILMAKISQGGRLLTRDSAGLVTVRSLDPSTSAPFEVKDAVAADLSADGKWLYFVVDGDIKRVNLELGPNGQDASQTIFSKVPAATIRISPDNQWLVAVPVGGAYPLLWSVPSPSEKEMLKPFPSLRGHDGPVSALEFSPDGHWLVTGGAGADKTLRLWDLTAPDPTSSIVRHRERHANITATGLTPDGRWLASYDSNGQVYVCDLKHARTTMPGDEFTSGMMPKSLQLTNDGRWLLGSSEMQDEPGNPPQTMVNLWELGEGGARRVELDGLIDLSAANNSAITEGEGELVVWKLVPGLPPKRRFTGSITPEVATPIQRVILSPDMSYMAASDARGGLWLWNLRVLDPAGRVPARKLKEKADENAVSAMAFSGDSEWFATGRSDGAARAWRVADAKLDRAIDLKGHLQQINAIVFIGGKGKRRLITASADGTALLFPIDSIKSREAEASKIFEGNQGPIWSAWADSKGSKLVTGGEDGNARIWNLDELDEPAAVVAGGDGPITTGTFDSGERSFTTVSVDGTVREWSLDRDALMKQVNVIVGRPLSSQEKSEYVRGSHSWWSFLTWAP
jgi:WD40 repeat protein/energy-coupling factor transporter ATP-binding protein EcfA2